MHKKVWALSPCFIFVSTLLVLVSCASILFNVALFYLEILVAFIGLMWSVYEVWNFKSYVKSVVRSSIDNLKFEDRASIERLTIPAVAVGANGEVLFFNSYFFTKVSNEHDCTGEMASQFFAGKTIDEILSHKGIDVSHAGRRYTVFGMRGDKSSLICFMDDTFYKECTREYMENKPSVGIVVFDNKEELLRNTTGEQSTQINASVEREIQKWIDNTTGFMKRISSDKFMFLIDERSIKEFSENKFKILDRIREVKLDNRQHATISIGIGKGAKSLRESELWARKALDMALGRGGDQVAIKCGDSYNFFGGKSKAVEKLGKVRTRVISSTLSDYIKSSDCVLIMGHKFSDLDSVGASIGMWSASAKGFGKEAYVVVEKEQTLAKPIIDMMTENGFKNIFISPYEAENIITDKTLLIIVDTHSMGFVESQKVYSMCKNVVVIDHHRMMVDHIKNSVVFYHEPSASSACEMVTEILQYIGERTIDNLEAEALLSGIMLDTKDFVQKTGVRTFEAAAFLKKCGADTIRVKKLFSNSLNTYKIKSKLISSVEIFKNCAMTFIESDYKDIRIACAQTADELLEIQGVEASFVCYKLGTTVNISARSMGDINVQVIMEDLGGGGHRTMAGVQLSDVSLEQVKSLLKQKIELFV